MPKKGYKQTQEHRFNCKAAAQKRAQDPEWRRKNREGSQKRSLDPEYRRNVTEANRRNAQDSEWIRKNNERAQKLVQDPEWRRKNKEAMQKFHQDLEYRRKQKEGAQKLAQDPEYKLKHKEGLVGGFCIQNITYPERLRYCELWCPDLWHRIDEAQNYQSILSGKTKIDNGGRALSRHHVYYQPKACCEWDEDVSGYYATINTGTKGRPNWYKHYIPGDPNKFVLLTRSEHGLVASDKPKWIKIFEDLIEIKLGGVCYLPKVA